MIIVSILRLFVKLLKVKICLVVINKFNRKRIISNNKTKSKNKKIFVSILSILLIINKTNKNNFHKEIIKYPYTITNKKKVKSEVNGFK